MLSSFASAMALLGAAFGLGLACVCAATLLCWLLLREGGRAACGAIGRFFGPGCKVTVSGDVVTVKQISPALELATATGEFEHSYVWRRENSTVFGVSVPFTGREASCRHFYVAKSGFNLKDQACEFRFTPVKCGSFLARLFGTGRSGVRVSVPKPKILSVESVEMRIEDRSGWLEFWNSLSEDDRHGITEEMLSQSRANIERNGGQLFAEAMQRLESGLRSIMPGNVGTIEIEWIDNPKAFDYEYSGRGLDVPAAEAEEVADA